MRGAIGADESRSFKYCAYSACLGKGPSFPTRYERSNRPPAANRAEIGALLGVPQPKVSALKNYRLDQFSVERLMEFLTALNQDVEIMIRPRANSSETGHISVLAAP